MMMSDDEQVLHRCAYHCDLALDRVSDPAFLDRLTVHWTQREQQALDCGLARCGDDMRALAATVPAKGVKEVVEYYFRRVYGAVQLDSEEVELPLLLGWDRDEEGEERGTTGRAKATKASASKATLKAANPSSASSSSSSSSSSISSSSSPPLPSAPSSTITPHETQSRAFLDRCRGLMNDALFEQLIDAILALHQGTARPAVAVEVVRGVLAEAVGTTASPITAAAAATAAAASVAAAVAPSVSEEPSAASSVSAAAAAAAAPAPSAVSAPSLAAAAAAAAVAAGTASELYDAFVAFLPAHLRQVAAV